MNEDLDELAARLRQRIAACSEGPALLDQLDELAAVARDLYEVMFFEAAFSDRPAGDDAFETLDLIEMCRDSLEIPEYWREAWPTASRNDRRFMTDRLLGRAREAAEGLEVAIDETRMHLERVP